MSDQIVLTNGESGETYYVVVYDASGDVWDGDSFEGIGGVTWTSVDIPLAEQGSTGAYKGTFPSGIPNGVYRVGIRHQAGGSPDVGEDTEDGWLDAYWDGSDLLDPSAGDIGTGVASTVQDDPLSTESYAADGALPSIGQALLMLLANQQAVLDGTTFRAKQLDGVTDAMTYVVDDEQNPTEKIRNS